MGIRPQSGARSRRTAALLSSGLLLASVLTSFVLMGNFPSELAEAAGPTGPNPPLGIHLSYLDDPTTAVVTWHGVPRDLPRGLGDELRRLLPFLLERGG